MLTAFSPTSAMLHLSPRLIASAICLLAYPAQAALSITAQETGGNVVFTWSGSLNLTGVTYVVQDTNSIGGGISSASSGFFGYDPNPAPNSTIDLSNPVLTPTSVAYGTGAYIEADSFNGDPFGFDGSGRIGIPFDYVSGNALSGSLTFNSATFTSLGLTEGTYNWTLPSTDTIQMVIPEPSLLAMSALGVTLLLRRRKGRTYL